MPSESRDPLVLITEFCAEWTEPDPAKLGGYFTDDAVFHNIPMEPLVGRAAIVEFIAGFVSAFAGIEFRVHNSAANGNVVFAERSDIITRTDGAVIELPVMGVFEVTDGKISAWRDYFDMAEVTKAFS
jgi:limonene-1,2-epoxide hydrolase